MARKSKTQEAPESEPVDAEAAEGFDQGDVDAVEASIDGLADAPEAPALNEPADDPTPAEPVVVVSEGVASTPAPEPDPLQDQIYQLNEDAFRLKAEWEVLAKKAKAKKGEWEEAVEEIQRLIRASRESFPLFPDKRSEKAVEPSGDSGASDADAQEAAAQDDWGSVLVEKLTHFGLSKAIVKKLAEADVFTVGDIAAWTNSRPLADVKGIGESAAARIDDALDKFWAARDAAAADDPDDQAAAEALEATEPDDDCDAIDEFPDDETGEGFADEFADEGEGGEADAEEAAE